MSKEKHIAFVNGLKALLQKDSIASTTSPDSPFDEEGNLVCDDEMKRLMDKFDELFGTTDDN